MLIITPLVNSLNGIISVLFISFSRREAAPTFLQLFQPRGHGSFRGAR